jgi:hypothetical protein
MVSLLPELLHPSEPFRVLPLLHPFHPPHPTSDTPELKLGTFAADKCGKGRGFGPYGSINVAIYKNRGYKMADPMCDTST